MNEKPEAPSQLPRRDFLKISSLALAGISAGSLPAIAETLGRRVSLSLISVGYAAAEPQGDDVVKLQSAESLLAGDPTFLSRDAMVTIRSSARALKTSPKARGAAIDFVYPALGYQPEQFPTFRAWSVRLDENGTHASNGVSFRVPVDGTRGLQMFLNNYRADDPKETAETVLQPKPDDAITLSLGSSSTVPKLQRGVYVVAYREAADAAIPSWSAYTLARRENELVIPNARFSYVVLSVDYAPQS